MTQFMTSMQNLMQEMNTLRICHWNANGIRQHKIEISCFLSANEIDVMLVSETHLTSKNNFFISGYKFYQTNYPDHKAHGSTGILMKSRLKHHSLDSYATEYLQASINIQLVSENLTLCAV